MFSQEKCNDFYRHNLCATATLSPVPGLTSEEVHHLDDVVGSEGRGEAPAHEPQQGGVHRTSSHGVKRHQPSHGTHAHTVYSDAWRGGSEGVRDGWSERPAYSLASGRRERVSWLEGPASGTLATTVGCGQS